MTTRLLRSGAAALVLSLAPALAGADLPIPLTISGNQASGVVQIGGVAADLTIGFESVVGLHPSALRVTAALVSPTDASIGARLPFAGGGIAAGGGAIPGAFPVLITIEPSEGSALSFSGVVTIALRTENLEFDAGSRLVLFSAHRGGPFRDITRMTARGSYRVGGSSGGFSEFLVVLDTRPLDTIIAGKYVALSSALAEHSGAMPVDVAADLSSRLSRSRSHHDAGQTVAAIGELDGFSEAVRAQSGGAIPDVWRAHDPRANVAGVLRAGADTLRFSLLRRAGS